jgi:hypothetical protein
MASVIIDENLSPDITNYNYRRMKIVTLTWSMLMVAVRVSSM